MTLTLNRSSQSNQYCLPAALALVTGLPVDDIVPLLQEHLGNVHISGVFPGIALKVLAQLGYSHRTLEPFDLPLAQIGERVSKSPLGPQHTYLLETRGHIQVLHDNKVWDNGYPMGIPYKLSPNRRMKVLRMWEILRTNEAIECS